MQEVNHECYVSLEVAKLLKEASFDWETRSLYNEQNEFVFSQYTDWNNVTICKSAPTLDEAQRWLREVKHEFIGVHPVVNKWFYSILRPNFGHYYKNKQFSTYEEALEAGIKKAFEIILEKGE